MSIFVSEKKSDLLNIIRYACCAPKSLVKLYDEKLSAVEQLLKMMNEVVGLKDPLPEDDHVPNAGLLLCTQR